MQRLLNPKTHWETKILGEEIETVPPVKKIPASKFLSTGKYPVIDQSQDFITGYTNDDTSVMHFDNPVVIFGDHTCTVKFADFSFAQGADGIKIITAKEQLLPAYLYQFLQNNPIAPEGYKRHFFKLKEMVISFPPLSEQRKIAAILSLADEEIRLLEKELQHLQKQKKGLMQVLLTGQIRV